MSMMIQWIEFANAVLVMTNLLRVQAYIENDNNT